MENCKEMHFFRDETFKHKEINEFIERRESEKLSKKMSAVGFIGFLLLLPAIITGYFGMNFSFITNGDQKISGLMSFNVFIIVS